MPATTTPILGSVVTTTSDQATLLTMFSVAATSRIDETADTRLHDKPVMPQVHRLSGLPVQQGTQAAFEPVLALRSHPASLTEPLPQPIPAMLIATLGQLPDRVAAVLVDPQPVPGRQVVTLTA